MIERLEQTPVNQEAEIINKLNDVVDAHNRHSELLDQIADKVLVEPKESAKREEKLYLTAEGMRAYDGSKWA